MRVSQILRQICRSCTRSVHAARLAAIVAVVEAITAAGRLVPAAVGRSLRGRARPKHGIKRVDRLLGNMHVLADRWVIFAAVARWLLQEVQRPVILMDWTKVTDGLHALIAAIPVGGRALPIYLEVHPEKRLGDNRVQARFLRALRDILPSSVQPIIVTDAGFHGPFFRAVAKLGWDFVGRIRGTAKLRFPSGGKPVTKKYVYAMATPVARDLGRCTLYSSAKRLEARMVLVRSKRRPGRRRASTSATEAAARESGRDPWLLATSLADSSAERIVATYALRMKIEETFRDAKNHRFGWSLRHVRSRSADRLTVLLLLAGLAIVAVTLLGFEAERRRVHRAYQANTVARRVLSHFVLGLALLRRAHVILRGRPQLDRAAARFRQEICGLAVITGAS
jgi:hypothetical protein